MPVFANVLCRQRPEWSSKIDLKPETGLLIQAVFDMRERVSGSPASEDVGGEEHPFPWLQGVLYV